MYLYIIVYNLKMAWCEPKLVAVIEFIGIFTNKMHLDDHIKFLESY